MKPLAGKRALVTGSSAGLGLGIALRLAQDGAEVCVHGRDADRLAASRASIAEHGGRVHQVAGSLSSDDGTAGVFSDAMAAMGGVDILINNAGGEAAGKGFKAWLDVTPEEWGATYNSNVLSMIRLIRLAVPAMREAGWGRIVNLSSQSVDMAMPVIPDYQAAKAAVRNLTHSLALTLANTGITVNSVSPGLTHSTNTDDYIRTILRQQGWDGDEATFAQKSDELMGRSFNGRVGTPEDIAHAIAMLVDPRGGHTNGIDILVDGGH